MYFNYNLTTLTSRSQPVYAITIRLCVWLFFNFSLFGIRSFNRIVRSLRRNWHNVFRRSFGYGDEAPVHFRFSTESHQKWTQANHGRLHYNHDSRVQAQPGKDHSSPNSVR